MNGMETQRKAQLCSAPHCTGLQGKATRVIRHADIPSRFGSIASHVIAAQSTAGQCIEMQ
jgi:hypothetical protein